MLAWWVYCWHYLGMKIIGEQSIEGVECPDLVTDIARIAWLTLRSYGEVGNFIFESSDGLDGQEYYEWLSTDMIALDEPGEFSAVLDQFPRIGGSPCKEVGFVALHLAHYDIQSGSFYAEESVELSRQQLVFRQETHVDGVGVFEFGTEDDPDLQIEITDHMDLWDIRSFLESLSTIMWKAKRVDMWSDICRFPESEDQHKLLVGFSDLLNPEDED